MIDISSELVVAIMLGGLLVLVITGYHLALVIGFLAFIVGVLIYGESVAQMFYLRTYKLMMNYVLLAVPLFVFMGSMLERSGIIERLYDALYGSGVPPGRFLLCILTRNRRTPEM